jgi:polar amino acid transport system substrate-binding protein
VLAVGLASLALLAACGSDGDSNAAAEPSSGSSASASGNALNAMLPDDIRERGVLRAASDATYPPFNFFKDDGKTMTGADYEIGSAIAAKLGVKFDARNTTFANIIPGLQSGQYDVANTFLTYTDERAQTLGFVIEYVGGSSMLVRKGNPDGITSEDDLCGKTVAATKGSIQIDLGETWSKECTDSGKPAIKVSAMDTDALAQVQVKSGRAVASIADSAIAGWDAKSADGGNSFEVIHKIYDPAPHGMAMKKSATQLQEAIKAAFQAVIDDGTYQKVLASYGLEEHAVKTAETDGAKVLQDMGLGG